VIDFTQVFTVFHHIFFDNDLWILYPDRDNLINIMQEDVFSDAAMWIAGIWLAASALFAAAGVFTIKNSRRITQ
jgi:integral membrane protein (TIGR01906 family)